MSWQVNKFIDLSGVNDELKGMYKMEEKGGKGKSIRVWSRNNNIVFELVTSEKTWGAFICLVINFKNEI